AGDGGTGGSRGGQRLGAGRLERGAESMYAGVGGGEGVIAGQGRLGIAAAEADGAGVARGPVAVGVAGGNGEAAGHAGGDRRREAGDREAARRRRVDGDPRLRASNTRPRQVPDRERLRARRLQDGAEGADALVGGRE